MRSPVRPIVPLALALCGSVVAAELPVLPFSEVRVGMKGTGRTVFSGTQVETFEVEILGKLPNIGPDQDLILARCSGGPLATTRVLSGMSGSPVTIDGKLVGAVAYSWGFSTEPIAGITPIEEMLAIPALDAERVASRFHGNPLDRRALDRLQHPEALAGFFQERLTPLLGPPGSALHVAVPLSVAGLGRPGLERIGPELVRAGFAPVAAGSGGATGGKAPRLEAGSAVGLQLVRGDVEMTATGTATWVDGDRVLALGHPLFGLGPVDLPLTGATVETLLPSLEQSSRVATPLNEIGAVRQDRASGVYGILGVEPRMIPVRMRLIPTHGEERGFSFDIADDPLLSPILLYLSLNGILATAERGVGNATVRLREGSGIRMVDNEDVELDNLFAGPTAHQYGTGVAAYVLYLLMNNAWSPPRIAGVNLIFEYDSVPKTGRIRRASVDRYRVRPGDTLHVSAVVDAYRGPADVWTADLKIPDATPPGPLTLQFGGALAMSRREEVDEPPLPRDLDQLIRLINQLRRNDRLYIAATREDSGVLLEGARMPNLPPSVSRILTEPRSEGNFDVIEWRRVLEESIPTGYAVEGWTKIQLEVEAP